MRDEHRRLFREGSTTYYNSARFFPKQVREDVFVLYGFVRKADNYVDAIPQDREGFYAFHDAWVKAESGTPSGDPVVDLYVELSRRRRFESSWTEAFLHAMELDLEKSSYNTIEETIEYMYGSAEVIGLFMCRIMELPDEALFHARMLGRAMQYINFIRDIDEDLSLGRRYLPLAGTPLKKLERDYALSHPELFRQFHGQQIELYRRWQEDAEAGYHYIPWRYLVPIKTAADCYLWTARLIEKDPLVVFQKKVKPEKSRVVLRGFANTVAAAWIILKKRRKV
jgi:15-cis-phytoene synthase